ncbi:MAG: pilus assembly protein PilM [Proteobacteria bacterium]|nr:pilus assembly protein PilM [Pseudomonadota bacterium]
MGLKRGLNISPSGVTWAEIKADDLSGQITQTESVPIAKGLVLPSFVNENIPDKDALKSEILKAIPAGKRKGDIALSIPDELVRISLVDFDEIPEKREEVEKLILWRLKKTIPIPLEMVKLDYIQLENGEGMVKLLVAVASSAVIREYENVVREIGLRPRLVDIASINTLMMYQKQLPRDAYFIYLNNSAVGVAVLLNGELTFFRSKIINGDLSLAEKEVLSTLMYYRTKASHISIDNLYICMTIKEADTMIEKLKNAFDGQVVQLTQPEFLQLDAASGMPAETLPATGAALRV